MVKERHLAKAQPILSKGLGILMRMNNLLFLDEERKKHGTADLLGKKECQRCGFCCLCMSCIPTPDELEVIAEYLGLTVRDTLKSKMVIDVGKGYSHYPKRAREHQEDMVGRLLPYNRTWDRGYCIFFDRRTHDCLIYDVRPEAARITECWINSDHKFDPVDYWSKEKLLELCPELDLGEED